MRTVIDLFLRGCLLAGLAHSTIAGYRDDLLKFVAFLGPEGREITPESILGFLNSLACRDVTRAGYWRSIRRFLNWASDPDRAYLVNAAAGLHPRFKSPAPKIVPDPPAHGPGDYGSPRDSCLGVSLPAP